ncbi:hypothetical protein ISN44_As07g014390 [Arabidopsis suecica]|uniref:Uncharacterized protein n=1 Tax=Arabidopsis suecica TaxID=45249 RepID=A0A8T2BW47_ARASU|nr:hypothetical protein ISN44_As07g014390 [Arabidopsis suecica]KAG7589124.1 hypothetical protein ISN44_As07g014390 [Arabidopsis suecica]
MKPLASSSLCFCKSDSSSKLRLLLCFYPILTDFDWEESFRAMSPAKGCSCLTTVKNDDKLEFSKILEAWQLLLVSAYAL